ncbi:MAG: ATP-dependent RecD-like DNA helicase [Fibrobacter sp.]|nr:ATP-dependent RecD-like DNA helicase [Fibrobacter sp.]
MKIQAKVLSTTFRNHDNGWSVIKVENTKNKLAMVAVGNLPPLDAGEFLDIEGEWFLHPRFGKQLQIKSYKMVIPEDGEALIKYLSGGMFPGIGLTTATRIVDMFGDETLDILDTQSEKLSQVKGLSGKRLQKFIIAWQEAKNSRETFLFLHEHNIIGSLAAKIWQNLGHETKNILSDNPYIISNDISFSAFSKADLMAKNLDLDPLSHNRFAAAMLYTLRKESQRNGHTYLPMDQCFAKSCSAMNLPINEDVEENMQLALETAVKNVQIIRHPQGLSFPEIFEAESTIANWIQNAAEKPVPELIETEVLQKHIDSFMQRQDIDLDPLQMEAIINAMQKNLLVITGGPGTGKTTSLRGILHLADLCKLDVSLAAPTGRAARRMSEITDRDAMTLHKLLTLNPDADSFKYEPMTTLESDILIVDEFSMVDTWLTYALIKALGPKTRLVIIGDHDQLPSIGPGNILRELLSHEQVPSVELTQVYRQKGVSDIVENAHRINAGKMPHLEHGTNFHHASVGDSIEALRNLKRIVSSTGKKLVEGEIQVLTPMHRMELGTQALNKHLQNWLNPHGEKIKIQGQDWRIGDKVMQLKNDYEHDIFNGDMGTILRYNAKSKKMTVVFEHKTVILENKNLQDLTLAYACTVHKSQGSEYDGVVIVLDYAHFNMLQRNLLYTAVTRAKEHVWIISVPGALETAVRTQRINRRYTRLAILLSSTDDFMDWMDS